MHRVVAEDEHDAAETLNQDSDEASMVACSFSYKYTPHTFTHSQIYMLRCLDRPLLSMQAFNSEIQIHLYFISGVLNSMQSRLAIH